MLICVTYESAVINHVTSSTAHIHHYAMAGAALAYWLDLAKKKKTGERGVRTQI